MQQQIFGLTKTSAPASYLQLFPALLCKLTTEHRLKCRPFVGCGHSILQ